jgi:hypothetical protein
MRLLIELYEMGVAEAKRTVHVSSAWADLRGDADRFHEAMADALHDLTAHQNQPSSEESEN